MEEALSGESLISDIAWDIYLPLCMCVETKRHREKRKENTFDRISFWTTKCHCVTANRLPSQRKEYNDNKDPCSTS